MIVARASYVTTERRTARKHHHCDASEGWASPCAGVNRGDTYLLHKAFPGHDAGFAGDRGTGRPVTSTECTICAIARGRGHLLTAPELAREGKA